MLNLFQHFNDPGRIPKQVRDDSRKDGILIIEFAGQVAL